MSVRRFHLLAIAVCLLLTTTVVAAKTTELARPLAKLDLADGDAIVFLGDSITHQCLYTQYLEDYFYTRFPKMRLKLHNAGVGGAVAWDALERFDADVAAYHPKYVTILLGMNDGRYRPFDEAVFQTYRHDMTELMRRLQSIGAVPIPVTPTMFDARARRMRNGNGNPDTVQLYNSVLAYYGTWLRDVAVERGFGFVDMWGPLNNITLDQRKTNARFTMIPEGVHPGPAGHVIMATAVIADLGLPRSVSNIRIATLAKGKRRVHTLGGKLSDLSITGDEVTFTYLADSLPWVVPAEAQQGAKLSHLGHRLSREALEIDGLPRGHYTLTIDGKTVGTYPAAALARHIELQSNTNTPQVQRAMEIAVLNKQRNDGPVHALRGEWLQFQQFSRARRAASQHPDNRQLQKQLAAAKAKIAGMDQRVAKDNAEAKKIEDHIFQINQPTPRHYVVRRVAAGGKKPKTP